MVRFIPWNSAKQEAQYRRSDSKLKVLALNSSSVNLRAVENEFARNYPKPVSHTYST